MKRLLTVTTLVVFASIVCLGLSPVEVSASPRIEVTKTLVGGAYNSGDDVEFAITVKNTSTAGETFDAIEVIDGAAPDCYRFIDSPVLPFTYTCKKFNAQVDFANRATGRGYINDANGCLVLRASDGSETIDVDINNPAIFIRKQAKGFDTREFPSGSDVEFEIEVINTGDVALTGVVVTDARVPGCERNIGPLDVGERVIYDCIAPNVTASFRNVARVTGKADNICPGEVSDTDISDVEIITGAPQIDIRKQTEGPDSRTFPVGSDVTFEIVVTNTGPVPLTDVEVTDLLAPACDLFIGNMAPGESVIYDCTVTNVVDEFTNEACVEGLGNGVTVTDCDPSTVELPQCDLAVSKTAVPDVIVPGPTPDCETEGKPTSLTFLYTGADCSASNNNQGDKSDCSGVPGADPVSITIVKDPNKFFVSPDSGIEQGDLVTLTAYGSDLGTEVQLYVGGQFLKIHTSCSAPLAVGDVFGSLTLVEFNGNSAADTQVTYTYVVTNSGDPLTGVTVSDDKLGIIAEGLNLAAGETQPFEKMADILATTTNTVTVTGILDDGTLCSDTDEATVTVEEPPAACTGETKVGGITFQYTGDPCSATTNDQEGKAECSGPAPGEPVNIVITRDADKLTASPSTNIGVGGTVTFTHTDGKFGAETEFNVEGPLGTQALNIHTSCSKPLAEGDQFGSMKVVDLVLIPK